MNNDSFNMEAYLERVKYSGAIQPTEDAFEAIHRAQVFTIPFENFDILLGRGISVEPSDIFDKMVHGKRGGYCFELNGLFIQALRAFGFEARELLARVHVGGTLSSRSHQISLVNLNGREWIADVGFGRGLRAPVPFEINVPLEQDGQTYRFADTEQFGVMLQRLDDNQWQDLYSFNMEYVYSIDIEQGNHFTSTHPSSFFTFSRTAALQEPKGLVTLLDRTLRRVTNGVAHEEDLDEGQSYLDALKANFGIDLDAEYKDLRPMAPREES